MKIATRIFLSFVILFFIQCSLQSKSGQTSESDKEKLYTAIEVFNKAFQSGDVQTLNSMITSDYVHTNGSSKSIDGASWINYLEKRSGSIARGKLEVTAYEMDEMEVIFYGDMALVTGRVIVNNKGGQGATKNKYRVTHVWVNESRVWKRAGFHDGKIK